MARAPRTPRINGCNVLADGVGGTPLWSFTGTEARPAGLPALAQVSGVGPAKLAKYGEAVLGIVAVAP